MEINGLDYNTQRERLIMSEYGREIQNMIKHAISIADKNERQICAETIIRQMFNKVSQLLDNDNMNQTLWDHLYIMSKKELDIDWPYDMSNAEKILTVPEPYPLPGKNKTVQMRHYGRLVSQLFEKLKEMPEGEERDALVQITANQMKRNLVLWGNGSMDDERIINDLSYFTDGKIQVNPNTFRTDSVEMIAGNEGNRKNKKKK